MAKDLNFAVAAANNASNRDEVIQKLVAAWNGKNARAGKKLGSFGFMAATLAACGGDDPVTVRAEFDEHGIRRWRSSR
jgi:hypothetical protein